LTLVYRILRGAYAQNPFDGEGAYRFGGRWSSPGTRLCYTSEHQSLAMLEYFVHLDPNDVPDDLVLAALEVPDSLTRERIEVKELPKDWRQSPAPSELAKIGDQFVQRAKKAILIVPSVVSVSDNNWLINPLHGDFRSITVRGIEPLNYDPRMFGKRVGRIRHKS
jgi:RES domain-containing protein